MALDAFPDVVIAGSVESIAPIATFGAASGAGVVTYDVLIALAPTDVPIRADMSANATVLVEELADVLKLPTWVVRVDRDTGQTYVHRQAGDGVERVDVVAPYLDALLAFVALVLDGLAAGDEVVLLEEDTLFN